MGIRGKIKTHYKTKSVFFALICFLVLGLLQGIAFAHETNSQDQPQPTVRILTLNIWAGNYGMDFERLQRQIQEVAKLEPKPDIIALQEVFDERAKQEYKNFFKDYQAIESGKSLAAPTSFQKLVNVAHKVVEWFSAKLKIAPWAKEVRAFLDGDSYGLVVLLNKEKGKVLTETQKLEVMKVQAGPTLGTKALERVKPKALLSVQYEVDGIRLLILNTHLSNGVYNGKRVKQLKQIINSLSKRKLSETSTVCPIVFCGDTNSDSKQKEMLWFHSKGGFRDTYFEANPDSDSSTRGGITWDTQNPFTRGHLLEPDQRIDYVSVRPSRAVDVEVLSSKVVFRDPIVSDHYGVLTELRFRPKSCEAVLTR